MAIHIGFEILLSRGWTGFAYRSTFAVVVYATLVIHGLTLLTGNGCAQVAVSKSGQQSGIAAGSNSDMGK